MLLLTKINSVDVYGERITSFHTFNINEIHHLLQRFNEICMAFAWGIEIFIAFSLNIFPHRVAVTLFIREIELWQYTVLYKNN